jgi:glycosyltransferase involved in cell wall biosynthesis
MLREAIRSALDQTFRDFEIVILDDASEDDTERVVADFGDDRVRYMRRDAPGGGAAARNAAIRTARGAFLAFLDDDDEWYPGKLERQMDVFRRSELDPGVVYAGYLIVDRATGRTLAEKKAERRGDLAKDLPSRNFLGGTSCVVARRELLESVGLFDEALPSFHDYDLWLRVAPRTRFDFVAEPQLNYYIHGKNIWRNYDALDRGIDRMLQKHGDSRALRRNLARQSLWVGVHRCRQGEVALGRRAMRRAVRLDPFAPRAYAHLGLSLLGGERYRRMSDARRERLALREGHS